MKILILGGGISGLTAAWAYRKKYPDAKITLLEKERRLGGWIQTSLTGGCLFEQGPRTFSTSRCKRLLELIREMGLEKDLIFSHPDAKKRFLWSGGKLKSVSSFLPRLLLPLLLEPFQPKGVKDDESIYDFAARRFGVFAAETLFDPLTLGIYGGDIRKLSIRSCFPWLFFKEQKRGFVLMKPGAGGPLFTLQGGMSQLIERLAERAQVDVQFGSQVEEIRQNGVIANGTFYPAEKIVSALPGHVIGALTGLWTDFPQKDLWIVQLAYQGDILPKKGFGYLVPTKEGENLLGMIWDSSVFPQQNRTQETRVTGMMRKGSVEALQEAMARHLKVFDRPFFSTATLAKGAIPQFEVGYHKRLAQFQEEMSAHFPQTILVGNYLKGPSVDACIEQALASS